MEVVNSRRPARRLLAVVPVVAVLALAGCGSVPPTAVRVSPEHVLSLVENFSCDQLDLLEDDVDFYDSMQGANCVYDNQSTLLVRAYDHDASVQQVLPDWTPTLSESNQLIVGKNWFAVGTPQLLDELSSLLDTSAQRVSEYEATPTPLSKSQQAIGACSAFVAAAVRSSVLDGTSVPTEAESVYPGISEKVVETVGELRTSRTNSDSFDADISELGPELKAFCKQWEKNDAQQ